MGKSNWYFMIPLGLLAICFSTLPLQAGSVTLNGTEWTFSYSVFGSENGTETLRVRLEGDTANYTDTGVFISNVAIKVDSIIGDARLVSAPTSLDDWAYLSGGLNSKGCSGKGNGWGCFDFAESGMVFGADVGGIVAWEFEVDLPQGTLPSGLDFKAFYVNADGSKNGLGESYVSLPEPSTLILLLSSMGLLGVAARFRRNT